MSDTNIATPLVQPSQSDVNGGVSGDGDTGLEKYVRELFKAVNGISYQITGNALPTTAADLNLIVPAGSAYISGYYVIWAQTTVALPASSISHIFIKLIFSSSLVSNVQIEDNVSGTHPADAIKLGKVVTSGSAITSSTDQRLQDGNQRLRREVISATGTTNWIVPANVTKLRIRQWGSGGGAGGGGGGGSTGTGGNGVPGYRGGYVEALVTVTPGATVTVINGTGGTGGTAGPGTGSNPGTGTAGGTGGTGGASSISGTGFSFTANGGPGGAGGSPGTDAANGANATWQYTHGTATQTTGTADLLTHGGGQGPGTAPGTGGAAFTNGTAGSAGQHAATIIDY